MREFDIELNEYISTGFAPNTQSIGNQPGLDECKELIVTADGLRARPLIHDLSVDFPTLGSFANLDPKVFDLNNLPICSNDNATFRIDVANPIQISALKNADSVADFNDFIFISNGEDSRELLLDNGLVTDITPASPSYPEPVTAAAYKESQGFIGVGKLIYWSGISKFDFTIGASGDAGTKTVTFPGNILRCLELDKFMVCYGDQGIMILEPVQQPRGAWKALKIEQLTGIGLRNFEELATLGDKHYFIGNDDNLWEITAELGIKRLGYDHLLKEESKFDLVPIKLEHGVYLVGENVSYFYATALSKVQHASRSLMPYYVGDEKVAGFPDKSEGYNHFEIRTNPIDFKHRQIKHVQAFEVGIVNDFPIECQVHWRRDFKVPFRQTPWIRLSPEGYVQIPCSGVDFKLAFRGQMSQDIQITGLKAKIKYENKSNLRGRYAY